MRKKIFTAIIIFFGVIILGIISLFIINKSIDSYARYITTIENAPDVDCIFVLGAGVVDGYPTAALEDRLLKAHELYQNGKSAKILVSGDHGTASYDEVNVMKDYLVNMGIPREAILQDHAGFNTYDSMYRAREIFDVHTMLICTNEFHIRRSLYIARRLGIEAWGFPTADQEVYNLPALNSREKLAKIKAFLDVEIFHRKPKLEGETIPIWNNDGNATDG
ncbi:MAG: YdcF family protein [Clostridiales bacterium]|jgi:vancomycin permeability regulator SanA|nr:YdcF family protein [Clostridiales bacterium]